MAGLTVCLNSRLMIDVNVHKKIADGSQSVVYEALSPDTGSPLAVKVSSKSLSLLKEFLILERVKAEPHTIQARSFAVLNDVAELRMQRLKTPDLHTLLTQSPEKFNFKVLLNILKQALEALVYYKSKDIVHSDFKLENCTYDFDTDELKIFDFGCSFCPSTEKGRSGSVGNCSPEVLLGQPVSFELDMWALGMMIFSIYAISYMFWVKPDDESLKEKMIGIFSKQFGRPFLQYYGEVIAQSDSGLKLDEVKRIFKVGYFEELGKSLLPKTVSEISSWNDIQWKEKIRVIAMIKKEPANGERLISILETIFTFENRITPEAALERFFPAPSAKQLS